MATANPTVELRDRLLGQIAYIFSEYKFLALLLIAGFLVRVWATRWPPFPIDMNDWIAWGERMRSVGPSAFYSEGIFADYAPGYIYIFGLSAWAKHTFFESASQETYYFLHRLPPILFDLGIAALVYITVNQARKKKLAQSATNTKKGKKKEKPKSQRRYYGWLVPTLAAACFLFSPVVWFNSAAWGQLDSSFTFFMVLSVVLLLRDRPVGAVVAYVLGFFLKPQAVTLAPVIAVFLLMRYKPLEWAKFAGAGIVTAFIVLFPFFGFASFFRLVGVLRKSVEVYPYTSMYMYNFWGIFYRFWTNDTTTLIAGMPARRIGTLLYLVGIAIGVVLMIRQLRKTTDEPKTVFFFATYFTFMAVMLLTRMHERYIYPALPFLLAYAFLYQIERQRKEKLAAYFLNLPFAIYLVVTVLHWMALYYVYNYYIHLLNKTSVDQSNVFFYFVERYPHLWSLLMLATFLIFTVSIFKWPLAKKAHG